MNEPNDLAKGNGTRRGAGIAEIKKPCKQPRILIVNQHGENRGDESALRAMIDGIEQTLGTSTYTIVAQLQDTNLEIPFREDVSLLHLKMPYIDMLALFAFGVLRRFGISVPFLLTRNTRPIIAAYEQADLVISAPGGPYFGDIYASHEIVHWFYVWLGTIYRKPLFLYAPSAGPFEIAWLNAVRRRMFPAFDILCVREDISANYVRTLMGEGFDVIVTADSAIQQLVSPCARESYFPDARSDLRGKFLVAVSAIDYRFPGERDPSTKRHQYEAALLRCLDHLATARNCHFLLIPQLYGGTHTDVPYLRALATQLAEDISWEIVDDGIDSTTQRGIFGMADLCIASRYHPQIFAATAAVPGICIYYEHKALGFMSALGLGEFAFDIRDLDAEAMCARLDDILRRRTDLARQISERLPELRARSARTTELVADLYRARCGDN